MIAALFVQPRGCYSKLSGVDPWPEKRDARLYRGNAPVVAHPPCARWCRLAGLVQARWGHRKGDDGGCFEFALTTVRRVGGVLEHPAYSAAWERYGIPRPPRDGGWIPTPCGGWTCHVEQSKYGHPANKLTWLYAHGVQWLPELAWGSDPDRESKAMVSWCGNHTDRFDKRKRVGKGVASKTPLQFRNILLVMAVSAIRE